MRMRMVSEFQGMLLFTACTAVFLVLQRMTDQIVRYCEGKQRPGIQV